METELLGFLDRQFIDGMELANESDLLDLIPVEFPLETGPPVKYLAKFSCTGLRKIDGEVRDANAFVVGITFTPNHLVTVDPMRAVTWLAPDDVFHPNIGRGPLRSYGPLMICIGNIRPAIPLVDLLYQTFEVITFNKATMTEIDALNWEACQWSRSNQYRFPVDHRPLKRGRASFDVREIQRANAAAGRRAGGI